MNMEIGIVAWPRIPFMGIFVSILRYWFFAVRLTKLR